MMNKNFAIIFLILPTVLSAQITKPEVTEVWDPEPRVVTPGAMPGAAPSDAIVLFDGTTTSSFAHLDDRPVEWILGDGAMTVVKGAGDIKSKAAFGSIQLHLEFRTPAIIESEGQGRGNSGIFFQGKYEVQILDSYQNRTYSNGQAGAIYKQYPPLVNPTRPPGEWQAYDIIFMAPIFNEDGMRIQPGYLTVFLNGVLVQNHALIHGSTEYIGMPKNVAHGDGPIVLQDHSNPQSFRNIWVRKL